MYQLTVLYNQPEDPAAFDKHYDEVHIPLTAKIPGLQRFTVSRLGTEADYYLVAVLEFASAEAFGAAMSTEEGKASGRDVANFGGAGVKLLTGEAQVV